MYIHCIRHGVTQLNIEGRFNGWIDEGITKKQKIELSRVHFDDTSYDKIYCSPMKRCQETAQALGIRNWIEEPRLKERNLGIFEAKTSLECEFDFAKEFQQFIQLKQNYSIPNGESRLSNLKRVTSWLSELQPSSKVLAITHGGPIDFLYRMAAGLELHGGDKIFAGNNVHISKFQFTDTKWRVVKFNQNLA